MERILQMEDANIDGSEQVGSSEDGQFVVALRKMVIREIKLMMIQQGNDIIRPIMEDLVRTVVKEEIQSAVEVIKKILASGNWTKTNATNAPAMSNERSLLLKFLDEVSENVLTGKEITGKGGTPMRVAIFDEVTGEIIKSGPESSAKVEILLVEASENDNEHNWSHQDFNSRIIKGSDKTKPHFAKSYHVYLEEGTGVLSNAKLANDSNWMKRCKCRLGAQVNLNGIKVQEAWTKPFWVSDSRSKLYEKRHPPTLSDPIWRLEAIARGGVRCNRLNEKKVSTVKDFLFLHSVDPQRLQEIVGPAWKAAVDHARTCLIDDKRIYVFAPSECSMSVVFGVVGELRGIIRDSNYILKNDLSNDEKDCAQKLLLSAFENREPIIEFTDETDLRLRFPCPASDVPVQEDLPGSDLSIPERIINCNSLEPGTSSQGISPSVGPSGNATNIFNLDPFGFTSMGRLDSLSPDPCSNYREWFSENFGSNQNLMSLMCSEGNDLSETLVAEPQSHQQSNSGSALLVWVAGVMLWMFRARKRQVRKRLLTSGQSDVHFSKRQRI